MNGKLSKKIRSEARAAKRDILVSVMRDLMTAPLSDRLRIAWRILRGK